MGRGKVRGVQEKGKVRELLSRYTKGNAFESIYV